MAGEVKMLKIAIVGAGGVIFTQNLVKDILLDKQICQSRIALMDIDPARLKNAHTVLTKLSEKLDVKADFEVTTNLEDALRGANYVITIFRCGTIEHQRIEYEIPARYNVKQCVGDTLNPGGIFRGLRTLKALFEVIDMMEKVCPGAYLLNYVNPMSMNTIALSKKAKTVKVIGLCHSVQGTSGQIADMIGVSKEKLKYYAAGVNHQAFMLKLEADGCDVYPKLRECLDKPDVYNKEKVRFEIMRHFGYFPTEGSGHGSEYNSYFRKRKDIIDKYCSVTVPKDDKDETHWALCAAGVPGASLEVCPLIQQKSERDIKAYLDGTKEFDLNPSHEYGSQLIAAIENNRTMEANLNVMNHGLIPTLPPECCVEVPCLVTGAGIFPTQVSDYPEQLAGLNRGMINAQIMGAEGAVEADRRKIFHAIALDPLTAAVCSLDEIQQMTDQMFAALADQIDPRFNS